MNTSAVAQNLASRGRNGDTTLVHMTPDEVQGLQALAMAQGGSLTINPETGLPEASFLSDTFKAIAPTLIGAGLTYFSGGAINPYMAAGIVGVGEGVRKDDIGAGLMAGLGAYGGAGMVKGLAGMGAGAGAAGGTNTALSELGGGMVSNTATAGGTAGAGSVFPGMQGGPSLMGGNITGSAGASGATTNSLVGSGAQIPGMQGGVSQAIQPINAQQVPGVNIEELAVESSTFDPSRNLYNGQVGDAYPRAPIIDNSVTADSMAKTAAERAARGLDPNLSTSFRGGVDTGIARLGEEGGLTAFKDSYVNAMGGPKRALLGGAGVLGSIADGYGAFDYKPMELAEAETDDYGYEGPYLPAERNVRFRGRDAILGGEGREFKFFDPVNPVPNVRTAAHGGLMSAKKMAVGGRYLDGPGDGVSDSIPATVDGEQPVLLSEGEYIIPAEVVSAVGNGSSDAGADKFTALVDTIMAKTRKVAKGKPNGSDKLLKGLVPQAA